MISPVPLALRARHESHPRYQICLIHPFDPRGEKVGGLETYIRDFITFHPDASTHVDRTLQLIRSEGKQAGLVFNPATPLDVLEWVIDKVDLVLIMSVNPGFGGQSFIDSALRKLEKARKIIDASGRDIRLEVDGGVKVDNIRRIADAGADTFVAGSAIFGKPDYKGVIDAMRAELAR